METVFILMAGTLLVLGLALWRHLVFWLTKTNGTNDFVLVIKPKEAEDCEFMIRSAAERIKWMSLSSPCRLVCVHEEGSEIHEICTRLSVQFPFLTLSSPEDLRYHIFSGYEEEVYPVSDMEKKEK